MEKKRKQICEAVRAFRLRKKLLSETTNYEDVSLEVPTNILLPTETEPVTESINEEANLTSLQSGYEDTYDIQRKNHLEVVQLLLPNVEVGKNNLKATHHVDVSHSSPEVDTNHVLSTEIEEIYIDQSDHIFEIANIGSSLSTHEQISHVQIQHLPEVSPNVIFEKSNTVYFSIPEFPHNSANTILHLRNMRTDALSPNIQFDIPSFLYKVIYTDVIIVIKIIYKITRWNIYILVFLKIIKHSSNLHF
jgi:hypothetical protein